ncbi:hypothetical protein C5167_041796 [Papaver somniferum]|nr:hypothetical protein C5167_041796 [Papaver somniferum]
MINEEENQILVGGGSKPVDGGEAEKKDQITMFGEYEIIRHEKIEIALGPSVYEKVKVKVYHNVIGDLCTCDITSNVTNGSVLRMLWSAALAYCNVQIEEKLHLSLQNMVLATLATTKLQFLEIGLTLKYALGIG